MTERRFPPPWSVEERPAAFVVCDHDGQPLAYVHFQEKPAQRSGTKLLTKEEARRVAVNIAGASAANKNDLDYMKRPGPSSDKHQPAGDK